MSLIIISLCLLVSTISAEAAPVVLRFSGQSQIDHPATKAMEQIAKEVAQKTEGRVTIKVYPANQLGDYDLVFEEMVRGTIDMACTSVPGKFDRRMEMSNMPGIVRDYKDVAVMFAKDGWMDKKMNEFEKPMGLRHLGWFIEGMIGIGSIKPVKEPLNPKVAKGVLCRVSTFENNKHALNAMGYNTTTIPYSDVYQALQTGVCDAVGGYPVAAANTMLRDVLKYWHNTCWAVEALGFTISEKTWSKLSVKDRAVLQSVIDKETAKSIAGADAEDERNMKEMEKAGIKVFRYTAKELVENTKACAESWNKLEKAYTPALLKDLRKEVARIQSINK
ncbi:MAG: TRAP transporter substrate-binding protein DctP [Bacteroidales bacterium]|nr:TRAP transporter substrate-binding protein DctP [Bacteroidales bacterium]